MSRKNIFEVLKNIAENTESNEKFLNILKENGFTGTLEEAENQINQQTQVVLNNLTTEDLQNIAGGKSLMNDKLKKALAVGGASLMAAGTVVPSSLAANTNDAKKFADSALNYVKKNPVHTGVTSILGLTTVALLAKSIFGGKTVSDISFGDPMFAYLFDKDHSDKREIVELITHCQNEKCKIEVTTTENNVKLKVTDDKNLLKGKLWADDENPQYTVDELLLKLVSLMNKGETYVDSTNKLTETGAEVLNNLKDFLLVNLSKAIVAEQTKANDSEDESNLEEKKKLSGAQKQHKEYTANKEKLETFITALATLINNAFAETNATSTADDAKARETAAAKYTANKSKKFIEDLKNIENFAELERAEIITDEIITKITGKFVEQLNNIVAKTKDDNIDAEKDAIKETIAAQFETFKSNETDLPEAVTQEKENHQEKIPLEESGNTVDIKTKLHTDRVFKKGDLIQSEPTKKTAD